MKTLSTLLVTVSLISNLAFAGIEEEVKSLSNLAMGHEVVIVKKSKDADDLFKNFAMKEYGEFDADRFKNKEIEAMAFGDEVDYGFTSAKSAAMMGEFAEGQISERLEGVEDPKEQMELKAKVYDLQKDWKPAINRLSRLGVKFGYDGSGPGYCGVSFIRLLVLDPKTNKVYTINLSLGGDC